MIDGRLENCISIIEDSLNYIEHWDGRGLSKEGLENLVGGIEYDLRLILDLLKEMRKYP